MSLTKLQLDISKNTLKYLITRKSHNQHLKQQNFRANFNGIATVYESICGGVT